MCEFNNQLLRRGELSPDSPPQDPYKAQFTSFGVNDSGELALPQAPLVWSVRDVRDIPDWVLAGG